MKSVRSIFCLLALALTSMCASAQSSTSESRAASCEYRVTFPISGSSLTAAQTRSPRVFQRIDSLLKAVDSDSLLTLRRVTFVGSASPEGSAAYNRTLSRRRANSISRHFAAMLDSTPTRVDWVGADWTTLRRLVEASPDAPDRARVLSIIDSGAKNRIARLRRLTGGRTYRWLLRNIFPQLRATAVEFTLLRTAAPVAPVVEPADTLPHVYLESDTVVEAPVKPDTVAVAPFVHRLYLKTNAVGWGMGIANAAVELDLAPHISLTVPFYYSAWEYGNHKVKFRTVAIQPEVRLWARSDNMGLFGAAHIGVAEYNTAIGGARRYQDYGGNTPAYGGGLSVGYRCYLGHSRRWMMEFSLGGGVYRLNYEAFDNSSVLYGSKLYDKRKTFVGVDNVCVNFIYSLPTRWKGGSK